MKFLSLKNQLKNTLVNLENPIIPTIYDVLIEYDHQLTLIDYEKKNVKKRKILLKIRKGLTKTEKKNSLKRDENNSILQQYLNLITINGDRNNLFKHFDKAVENFFYILNDQNDEFFKYKNYIPLTYLSDNFIEYNDFNFILKEFLLKYLSIFDIKTKKNPKRIKSLKKYRHEIVYIPKPKRLKNVLKLINDYTENFKNYEFWERLFWMFVLLIFSNKKSFLIKRRSYIYKKSIKFFMSRKSKK